MILLKKMNADCTVYKTLEYLGKRWVLLILLELHKGEPERKRYSELKRRLPGITAKILSSRLKMLESEGLIGKEITDDSYPIISEYYLTNSGKDFIPIIKDIKKWALKWKVDNNVCKHKDCYCCEL